MHIIIDTREQKPLKFTGHKTTRRKLDEGDYATIGSEPFIVIERKSINDYYGSITNDHSRFKKEIQRALYKQKLFFIFLEGSVYDLVKYVMERKRNPATIMKIIKTMKERYGIRIIECKTRDEMEEKMMKEMKKW